jgi:hypothetical protein
VVVVRASGGGGRARPGEVYSELRAARRQIRARTVGGIVITLAADGSVTVDDPDGAAGGAGLINPRLDQAGVHAELVATQRQPAARRVEGIAIDTISEARRDANQPAPGSLLRIQGMGRDG